MNNKLIKIYDYFSSGDYNSSTKEACVQIEVLLRNQIKKNLSLFTPKVRLQINQYEAEAGKGQKGIEDFNMGEIVGLYRKADLFDECASLFNKDMTPIKMFNLNYVVDIRNKLTHEKDDNFNCSEDSAKIVISLLELLIQLFDSDFFGIGLFGKPGTIVVADNKSTFDKSSIKYLSALDEAMKLFVDAEDNTKLTMIDLGCRDGNLTLCNYLRYSNYIDKVFAISESEELFKAATNHCKEYDNVIPVYIEFDDNLYDNIVSFLSEQGIDSVDIVYSDGRYRQIKDSDAFYRKLRRNLLSDNGGIILKAFDDGSKICYPDPDKILQKIIDKTAALPIVSDRFSGRKIYSQYWKAGFRCIKSFYIINDTVGLSCDDRLDLYEESFDYRMNYFKKLMDNETTNSALRKEVNEMKTHLSKLQDYFCDDSFYYSETNYILVARKQGVNDTRI